MFLLLSKGRILFMVRELHAVEISSNKEVNVGIELLNKDFSVENYQTPILI
jgi:hypothetical protein